MDDKNDGELNDISAYYEGFSFKIDDEDNDTAEPQSGGSAADAAEEQSGGADGDASDTRDCDDNGSGGHAEDESEKPNTDKLPSKTPAKVYAAAAAAAIALIAGGFAIGRLVIPVSENAVENAVQRMYKTDTDYLAALNVGENLQTEIDELNANNERISSAFDDVVEYEKQLDELKNNFQVLNDELYNSRSDLKTAQDADNRVQNEISELHSRTVTLSPGTYTVGVHIPSGTYLTTGNGSLLTAGADKTLKTNVNLDSSTPYRCTLADNDTIKLSTEAVFSPEVNEQ